MRQVHAAKDRSRQDGHLATAAPYQRVAQLLYTFWKPRFGLIRRNGHTRSSVPRDACFRMRNSVEKGCVQKVTIWLGLMIRR